MENGTKASCHMKISERLKPKGKPSAFSTKIRFIDEMNLFAVDRSHKPVVPKLWVNYPPGVICDSSGSNAEPKL